MSIFDNDKNPADVLPETQPTNRTPEWFLTFLVIASIYAVFAYFQWGSAEGELALEKAKHRTYQSLSDYEHFVRSNP